MSDYSKGKIYKIYSDKGNEVYIGSTIATLNQRYNGHKHSYKKWKEGGKYISSSIIFEQYGIDNCKIELLLEWPCESCDELTEKEQEIINNTENCVNKIMANRSEESYSEYNKQHCKNYRENNKEYFRNYMRLYRQNSGRDRSLRIVCDCGVEHRKEDSSRHLKSQKHQNYLNSISK